MATSEHPIRPHLMATEDARVSLPRAVGLLGLRIRAGGDDGAIEDPGVAGRGTGGGDIERGAEAVIETLADQEGSDIDRAAIDALDARDRALQCSQSRASARSWSSPM